MIAYKLFRVRKDGSIGPLFINRKQRVPLDEWLQSEDHPTKGYARRPGWHVAKSAYAPHLNSKEHRRWYVVEIEDYTTLERPAYQGNLWFLAMRMKVLGPAFVKESGDCYGTTPP